MNPYEFIHSLVGLVLKSGATYIKSHLHIDPCNKELPNGGKNEEPIVSAMYMVRPIST